VLSARSVQNGSPYKSFVRIVDLERLRSFFSSPRRFGKNVKVQAALDAVNVQRATGARRGRMNLPAGFWPGTPPRDLRTARTTRTLSCSYESDMGPATFTSLAKYFWPCLQEY
jgi:hypothetical protein